MPLHPKLQTGKNSPGHLRRACSCQEESAWHGIEQTHSESGSKLNQHWPGHCQLRLLILGPGGRSPVPSLEVLCRCCQGPRVLSGGASPSKGGGGRSYSPAQLCSEAMLSKVVVLLTRNLGHSRATLVVCCSGFFSFLTKTLSVSTSKSTVPLCCQSNSSVRL